MCKNRSEGEKICSRTNAPCVGRGFCKEETTSKNPILLETSSGANWIQPKDLEGLVKSIKSLPTGQKYKLVGGNTGTGIYPDEKIGTFVNLHKVKELKLTGDSSNLSLGAAMTLNEVIAVLEAKAKEEPIKYGYGTQMAEHIKKVLPGCSFHCEHFMESTLTLSFRYKIV